MNANEIKPWMWLRHRDGTAWRVVLSALAEWAAVDVHGRGRLIIDPSTWKPWEAWPGEWVRDRQGNTWRVAQLVRPPADLARAYGYAVDGTCHDDVAAVLEPVVAPNADPDAASDAILAERVQGLAERKPLRHVETATDCGGTCPRCTGTVATLLCMPCQGPAWRDAEPEVRELWVGFRRDKRPWETGIRDVLFAPCPGAERWWQASGRGHSENHPIREEAIRLWRETVRGGR